jgi:hypothetical protein
MKFDFDPLPIFAILITPTAILVGGVIYAIVIALISLMT